MLIRVRSMGERIVLQSTCPSTPPTAKQRRALRRPSLKCLHRRLTKRSRRTMTSKEPVYLPCGNELSQGDIVNEVPWGLVHSPLTVCRPSNAKAQKGPARYAEAAGLSDGFRRSKDKKECIHAKAGLGLGIVLWHSCEIDDFLRRRQPQKAFVGVAPIFSMAERVPEDQHREAIRRRDRSAFFPLEPLEVDGFQFGEAYVDFRLIWSVKQSTLTTRLATLGETVRHSLYDHLILFLTRRARRDQDS